LEPFIGPMLAMAGAQFPRECGACRRSYGDFKQFVRETRPIGAPTLARSAEVDPISMISWTNCPCGSTLVLTCGGATGEMHGLFTQALEDESRAGGTPVPELLLAIRAEVRRRVLSDPE
jgi:hypothetical protein